MNKPKQIKSKISKGILHEVPGDIEKVLTSNSDLLSKWENLTPIQRNEWICWVTIVKKQETRNEHISRMIEELKEGKRQPCCWPGCPHRKPAAQKWFKNLDK
ncbi:MAG: YdeI/OmpD-associated family protein [Bacteroidetes bacterium]|nr:YdeI/OmpD-associated family protein [Bacteroidota bacterium]